MVRCAWMFMLAGLFAAMGCDQRSADQTPAKVTSEDVRHDIDQAAKTAAEFSQQTKEEFEKKLDARLKELDAEIARLREKGGDLKDEAKANRDKKMAELETKRDAAPHQASRGPWIERRGLEGCPERGPVGLGRIGESLPRRLARVLIDHPVLLPLEGDSPAAHAESEQRGAHVCARNVASCSRTML